ncbi:fructose-1,6-bisphosphatase [Palleronia marisminoris]|uniref:Inositol-1-monophosphatase n=1 Tax=Palleronia marisminoris TaxID=315423 RepID=A0A1Y5TA74_9RHOB|nr:inositol monophosphatase [Palleronia marisminoris]SFH17053.1 fructose-1,6-bisphosphatase [Palleronia marisminoris]SLN55840.1 Inositol-1-monophosphatase [Palleronia marisminoris]
MDERTAEAIVEAVRDVARAEIMPRFRALSPGDVETKTGPEDLVTVADTAAEDALTRRLAEILPGVGVVGEEAVEDDPTILDQLARPDPCLVIDPIDGTWNFARGLAVFGVIIALREAGKTVMGLLYDPVCDDWMIARAGQGAHFVRADGSRVALSTRAGREPAMETGYLPLGMFDQRSKEALAPLLPAFSRVQSLRCSLYEYRTLAAGHVDWLVASGSKPWDHLAGQLVVEEAGGVWGTLAGGPYDPTNREQVLLATAAPERLDTLRGTLSHALG